MRSGRTAVHLDSLLHGTGVNAIRKDKEVPGEPSIPLEVIKTLRQFDSRCACRPEFVWTTGVEPTTGPLGPEWANSSRVAIVER